MTRKSCIWHPSVEILLVFVLGKYRLRLLPIERTSILLAAYMMIHYTGMRMIYPVRLGRMQRCRHCKSMDVYILSYVSTRSG